MAEKPHATHRQAEEFGSDSLRVITAIAGLVGLGLALVAVIVAMVNGSWSVAWYAPWWMLGVGLLAIVFFVFFNFEWLAGVVTGRAALSGLSVGIMCAVAVVLWICGNLVFNHPGRFNFRVWKKDAPKTTLYKSWDLTRTGRYSLDPKTVAQLRELGETLEITVIYRGGPDEGPELDAMLERYREASERVKLEFLMPGDKDFYIKRKRLADKLNKDPEEIERRSVSLVYKDRFKYLTSTDLWEERPVPRFGQVGYKRIFKGEEALTSAIYEMVDTEKTRVYFLVDHGERSPEQRSEEGTGMYYAGQLLKRSNIDWKIADLRTWKEVPADASIVVLCGPRSHVSAEESAVLIKYLAERQGRLLVCLDEFNPAEDLGLDGLLEFVGVQAGRDFVVEKNPEYSWARMRGMTIGKDLGYEPRALLEKLREGNVRPTFRAARSLRRLEGYRGEFQPQDLCMGSAESYGETDLDNLVRNGRTELQKDADNPGPVVYAMACYEGPAPMPGGRMQKTVGRVVVVGDSDWCSDALIPVNRSLFMGVVNWLAGKEKRISIEPKLAEDESYQMLPQHRKMSVIVLVIIPLFLGLTAGLVAWSRRR